MPYHPIRSIVSFAGGVKFSIKGNDVASYCIVELGAVKKTANRSPRGARIIQGKISPTSCFFLKRGSVIGDRHVTLWFQMKLLQVLARNVKTWDDLLKLTHLAVPQRLLDEQEWHCLDLDTVPREQWQNIRLAKSVSILNHNMWLDFRDSPCGRNGDVEIVYLCWWDHDCLRVLSETSHFSQVIVKIPYPLSLPMSQTLFSQLTKICTMDSFDRKGCRFVVHHKRKNGNVILIDFVVCHEPMKFTDLNQTSSVVWQNLHFNQNI